jgi:AcrR family transcriptional regulator
MASGIGLRERKKQRTRAAIVEAAMRLFAERGFDGTTIADIAAEADIAPRTFFGYFPSKEEVVFNDFDADFKSLGARLAGRPPGETAIGALRTWVVEPVAAPGFDAEAKACRRRLIVESDALAARDEHVKSRFRDLLAEAVARDLADTPDALRPRMVAAAAIAALEAISERDADALAVLGQATAFLRGGLDALAEERSQTGPQAGYRS